MISIPAPLQLYPSEPPALCARKAGPPRRSSGTDGHTARNHYKLLSVVCVPCRPLRSQSERVTRGEVTLKNAPPPQLPPRPPRGDLLPSAWPSPSLSAATGADAPWRMRGVDGPEPRLSAHHRASSCVRARAREPGTTNSESNRLDK